MQLPPLVLLLVCFACWALLPLAALLVLHHQMNM
jgi:hypothetical protein